MAVLTSSVMESPTLRLVLVLSLSLPASGDVFDKLLPSFTKRFDEIRKAVLPFSEFSYQEAIFHFGSYFIPVDGQSEACRNHSNYVLESLLSHEIWALRMVDAASKLPPGMLDGRLMDLGSYDECLSITAPGEEFRGQYCFVETQGLLPDTVNVFNPNKTIYPSIRVDAIFSICVPSTCSYMDVMAHLNEVLRIVNATALLVENSCTTSLPDPLSTGDWVATFVIVIISSLVFLSTLYDNLVEADKNQYLAAFSLKANIVKMLSTETKPSTITCLNGLRVLGFLWVLLGHRLMFMIAYPGVRHRSIFENIASLEWAPLENGLLSVDIFFFMTGLLATYGYLKYRQRDDNVSLVHFYLLRYLRMTPALAFIAMITATIGIRFTDGPLWKRVYGIWQSQCRETWRDTLLYIQNYTEPLRICLGQSWYLAADFQMYVFSPLLLIPLHKKPKLGLVLTALFLVMTTVAGLWNAYSLELRAGGGLTYDRRTEYTVIKDYLVTHVRAATFIMGVAMGFLLFKVKEGQLILKMSRASLWAGWLASISFIQFSVFFVNHFQQEDYVYCRWLEVTYQVFHRHIFILGISWIVLVCTLGYGGIVDMFLSWKPFIPLARLTYSAFLLHMMLQFMYTANSRSLESITILSIWHQFFGDVIMSYLYAAVLFLLVECPCSNIVTLTFQDKKKTEELPKSYYAEYASKFELPVFKEIHSK